MVSPGGSPVADHDGYGAVPPVAVICTCSAAAMAHLKVVDPDLPSVSVTVTVTSLAGPTVVGVPDITPVEGLIDRAGGSPVAPHGPGLVTDQLYGPVPPLSAIGREAAVPTTVVWFPGLVSCGKGLTVQVKATESARPLPSVAVAVTG